jgi:hypothetical protein
LSKLGYSVYILYGAKCPKGAFMKKNIFLIALVVVGLAVVSAQQPVPLPPLPNITLTMPPRPAGATPYGVNVTSAQLRRLLEIKDQRNYELYLFNSGYITRDEYRTRDRTLEQAEGDLILPIIQADQIAYIYANSTVEGELKKIWSPDWAPGWHGQAIRECLGFALIQPQGTRATSQNEDNQMIRMNLRPLTDEIYNNIKQQIERGTGEAMTYEADFNRHIYVLRSNRSASGKPYFISVQRYSGGRVYIEVSELRNDP